MTKILFMGRKPVAAKCLEHLLTCRAAQVVAVLTDSHLNVSPTSDVARAHGIAVLSFEEALQASETGALKFDLGISMLYWRRLRGALLDAAKLGIINFHPAPLPGYKGVGGYNLAILDELSQWACTAHYMDAGIDTGEIICTSDFPINTQKETAHSLEVKCQAVLYSLFKDVLGQALARNTRLPATPNIGGRHLSRPDLEALKRIDITKDNVAQKARAFWFPPYDGAFIEIDGQKFTLVERCILDGLADPNASSLFSPGANKRLAN